MDNKWIILGIVVSFAACKGKDGGGSSGGDGGGGTVVGKLAARELESANKELAIKGQLPESWVQDPSAMGIKLVHRGKDDQNLGHVEVSVDYTVKPPEERAKDTASDEKIHGAGSLVVPATEISPGRWGNVLQSIGMQWKPGINMYEATAYWTRDPNQVIRCKVRWMSKAPGGALDLCKAIEVTKSRAN